MLAFLVKNVGIMVTRYILTKPLLGHTVPKGDYLKSLPTRLPFSGSPGSGQELEACLIPPSFTANSEHSLPLDTYIRINIISSCKSHANGFIELLTLEEVEHKREHRQRHTTHTSSNYLIDSLTHPHKFLSVQLSLCKSVTSSKVVYLLNPRRY